MRRRSVVGIAIGSNALRVLLLNGERVLASSETTFADHAELWSTLDSALDELLRPFGKARPHIAAAALGPYLAQLRSIPPGSVATSPKAAQATISENPSQYFVLSENTLTIAVSVQKNGQTWTAGFDRGALEQVCEACNRHHLDLVAAAPTVLALRAATSQLQIAWRDDGSVSHVTYEPNGEINSLRRLVADDNRIEQPPVMEPTLAAMGSDAWPFADAFGATAFTTMRRLPPLVLSTGALPPRQSRDRTRTGIAAGVAALALGATLVSPGLAARRDAARADSRLRAAESQSASAATAYREAAAASKLIVAIDRIEHERRSMTFAIAALTRAIPEAAFLTDLRLDDAGGTLVVIAPRTAAVVAALATFRDIAGPTLVGAVVPQAVNDATLERATIRFRWANKQP
jgi:hypothetical protein